MRIFDHIEKKPKFISQDGEVFDWKCECHIMFCLGSVNFFYVENNSMKSRICFQMFTKSDFF